MLDLSWRESRRLFELLGSNPFLTYRIRPKRRFRSEFGTSGRNGTNFASLKLRQCHHADALETTDFSILRPSPRSRRWRPFSFGSPWSWRLWKIVESSPYRRVAPAVRCTSAGSTRPAGGIVVPCSDSGWETVGVSSVESSVSDVRRLLERGASGIRLWQTSVKCSRAFA